MYKKADTKSAYLGGILGAAGGGIIGVLSGKDRKERLRRALVGLGLGGLVGGAAGYGLHRYQDHKAREADKAESKQVLDEAEASKNKIQGAARYLTHSDPDGLVARADARNISKEFTRRAGIFHPVVRLFAGFGQHVATHNTPNQIPAASDGLLHLTNMAINPLKFDNPKTTAEIYTNRGLGIASWSLANRLSKGLTDPSGKAFVPYVGAKNAPKVGAFANNLHKAIHLGNWTTSGVRNSWDQFNLTDARLHNASEREALRERSLYGENASLRDLGRFGEAALNSAVSLGDALNTVKGGVSFGAAADNFNQTGRLFGELGRDVTTHGFGKAYAKNYGDVFNLYVNQGTPAPIAVIQAVAPGHATLDDAAHLAREVKYAGHAIDRDASKRETAKVDAALKSIREYRRLKMRALNGDRDAAIAADRLRNRVLSQHFRDDPTAGRRRLSVAEEAARRK